MKSKFVKYPSLRKFKDLKKSASSRKFNGLVDGEPTFVDNTPVLQFTGTVKLHGTHASIVYWRDGEVTYQSRNRLLTPQNDNHGFATAMVNKDKKDCSITFENSDDIQGVMYDGEWCGGNIQSGVALLGAEKQFIITNVSHIHLDKNGEYIQKFHDGDLNCTYPFQSINDFKVYDVTVDFSDPEAYEKLMKLTLEVEENCPVGAVINPNSENTIGEGIVWSCYTEGYRDNPEWWMKVKGTKHERAGGKVRKQQTKEVLTDEQQEALEGFVKEALTVDRLEQGIEYLKEMEYEVSEKSTGYYLKWFLQDVAKETEVEANKCYTLGLTWKSHLSSGICKDAKNYYFDKINS